MVESRLCDRAGELQRLPAGTPTQQLVATGELVAADGTTPVTDRSIDAYRLTFVVADGNEIERTFTKHESGDPIRTNDAGRFHILESNLALSYDWQQDEYVCQDICTEWVTTCHDVSEEVCAEQCAVVTYDECWDECWDECDTTCHDETYCDDEGCWTETVCSDDCTNVCETVCQPVTEEQCWDECHVEVSEQCNDDCTASVESCEWVTMTYTTFPALSDIVSTRAEIRLTSQGDAPSGSRIHTSFRVVSGNLETRITTLISTVRTGSQKP